MPLQFREGNDLIHSRPDLVATQAQNDPIEKDVLDPGKVGMETRAELEERCDAAVNRDCPTGGLVDPRQEREHRALPCPVPSDDGHTLARKDLQVDAAQHFQLLDPSLLPPKESRLYRPRVAQPELLAQLLDLDGRTAHGRSTNFHFSRLKVE